MNIWAITWRSNDGSSSGVLPWAFTNEGLADQALDVLVSQQGDKGYGRMKMMVIDAKPLEHSSLPAKPGPRSAAPVSQLGEHWWRRIGGHPHAGVTGVTPFDHGVLTLRTLNALRAEGIETLEQVVCWREQWLLMLPNLGRKSLNELKEYLHSKGLELRK